MFDLSTFFPQFMTNISTNCNKLEECRKLLIESQTSLNELQINFLTRINDQLSLWTNPYGIMVGALSALFAILAICSGLLLFRQSSEYKKQLLEEKNSRELEFQKFLNEQKQIIDNQSGLIDEQKKLLTASLEDSNKKIDSLIKELEDKQNKTNFDSKQLIKKQIEELKMEKSRNDSALATAVEAKYYPPGSASSKLGMNSAITLASLTRGSSLFPETFSNSHICSKCHHNFSYTKPSTLSKSISTIFGSLGVPCPKCNNIDLV